MRKISLIIIFVISFVTSFAQSTGTYDKPGNAGIEWRKGMFDSSLIVPFANLGNAVRSLSSNIRGGAIAFDVIRGQYIGTSNGITYDITLGNIGSTGPLPVDLVHISGQSNAVGAAQTASLNTTQFLQIAFDFFAQQQRVYISDSLGLNFTPLWLKHNNATPLDTTLFGPEMAFAYQWSLNNKNGLLFIDKSAVNGACISGFISSPWISYTTTKRTNQLTWFSAHGYTPIDIGFVWIQGECDGTAGRTKAQYTADLDTLLAQQRRVGNIGLSTRVILSGISKYSTGYAGGHVDSALRFVATTNPYYRYLYNDTLMDAGGGAIHYAAYGMLQLGSNAYFKTFDADSVGVDTTYKTYAKGTGTTQQLAIWLTSGRLGAAPFYYDGTNFGYGIAPNASNAKHNFLGSIYGSSSIYSNTTIQGATSVVAGTVSGAATMSWDAAKGTVIGGTSATTSQVYIDNASNYFAVRGDANIGNNLLMGGYINLGPASTATSLLIQNTGTARKIYTTGGVALELQGNGQPTNIGGSLTFTGAGIAMGGFNITGVGSINTTGSRVTKIWGIDAEFTNAPTVGGVALPTRQISTIASTGTGAPIGSGTFNNYSVTALAGNITFSAPSGTPAEGNRLVIRIKDNGISRTIAWNSIYRSGTTATLPIATTLGKNMYVILFYNADDAKWDVQQVNDGY